MPLDLLQAIDMTLYNFTDRYQHARETSYSISGVIMITKAAGFHTVAVLIQQAAWPHIPAG
jgi:hypothetical protein